MSGPRSATRSRGLGHVPLRDRRHRRRDHPIEARGADGEVSRGLSPVPYGVELADGDAGLVTMPGSAARHRGRTGDRSDGATLPVMFLVTRPHAYFSIVIENCHGWSGVSAPIRAIARQLTILVDRNF